MLIAGLRFPLTTAVLGAVWGFGRILYTRGYTSDAGPKGRVL